MPWLDLEPGASKTITFVVPMSLLGYTGLSGDFVIEPGPVEVSAGSRKTRSIRGEDRAFLSVTTVGSPGARRS
jgi:Fibronectin type III-like domain